jgi:DNA-binding CsgD family transcriptional regulator
MKSSNRWRKHSMLNGMQIHYTCVDDYVLYRVPVAALARRIGFVEQLVLAKLTQREEQVLQGMREGKQHKEIASDINLSTRTVKFHACSIYHKLKIQNRVQLLNALTLLERNGHETETLSVLANPRNHGRLQKASVAAG